MKRNKTNFLSILCLTAIMLCSAVAFGQTKSNADAENLGMDNGNSSITLKTMRALFPDVPVAIANELQGGLHVVNTINQLHGYVAPNAATVDPLTLNDNDLQVGMLVFVVKATKINTTGGEELSNYKGMYYRYLGPDPNDSDKLNNKTNTATEADPKHWQSFADFILKDNGLKVTIKDAAKLPDDANSTTTNWDNGENPGDHIIVQKTGTTTVLGAYVWGNDDQWHLVSRSDIVVEQNEQTGDNWSYSDISDGSGEIDNPGNYNVGDIVKLVSSGGSFVTWACDEIEVDSTDPDNITYTRSWVKISEFKSDVDKGLHSVYYDLGTGINTFIVGETAYPTTGTTTAITALNMNDFREKLKENTDEVTLTEDENASGDVIILYYPVNWSNPLISIQAGSPSAKYELTNGILIETVNANSVDSQKYTATDGVLYKKATIRCGDEGTIYID